MVQVEVAEGILEGEFLENEFGEPYYSFKGIPYAEPPVGELRFKAPKPAKPWSGVRQAKEFGQVCFQKDPFAGRPAVGSEDCLYLNVYSPNIKPAKPLPVMFWIHGGGYLWWSGNDDVFGPEFLMRKDVILVTINYRLGVLGFLSLDTKDVPGNAGMKDQVQALRWVNKNISQFGGDPNNVTIFGESAGASSASFHLVSPMTKGLFKRAIIQSGSVTCFWATTTFQREIAEGFARQLGFYSTDDKELYEFYKTQPIENFINPKLNVTQARKIYGQLRMVVVSEKKIGNNERYFYGDVYDNLKKENFHEGVDVIIGYTEHDGVMGLSYQEFDDDLDKLLAFANDHVEFFVPNQIALECSLVKQLEVGKKIKKFHIKEDRISRDNLKDLIDFITIDFFAYDTLSQAKFLSKKNKTYVYRFTCKSERNQIKNLIGLGEILRDMEITSHVDDLAYIFPQKEALNQKVSKNSEEFRLIDCVTTLWTNFAKYGDPTPDNTLGVQWSPYTIDSEQYLDIGNKLFSSTKPNREFIDFWDSIFKEYLPRCSVYSS